jgi:hypothetical protein
MSCIKYKSGQWTYDDSHSLSQIQPPAKPNYHNVFAADFSEHVLVLTAADGGAAAIADRILAINFSTLWGPVCLSWHRPRSPRLSSMCQLGAAHRARAIHWCSTQRVVRYSKA